jgi:hypothetical protein
LAVSNISQPTGGKKFILVQYQESRTTVPSVTKKSSRDGLEGSKISDNSICLGNNAFKVPNSFKYLGIHLQVTRTTFRTHIKGTGRIWGYA